MSVATTLKISTKWTTGNIVDILENRLGTDGVRILTYGSITEYCTLHFTYNGEQRMINFHSNSLTPIGQIKLLSMGSDETGREILLKIAKVIGGYYTKNDYEDDLEEIIGMTTENDGLTYFVKHAILTGDINGRAIDIDNLEESIRKWYDRYNPRNQLFKKGK